MEDKIKDVLVKVGKMDPQVVKNIGLTDSLRDAGLTSLSVAQIMLGLEDEFDIVVPDEYLQAEHYESIKTIIKIVESSQ